MDALKKGKIYKFAHVFIMTLSLEGEMEGVGMNINCAHWCYNYVRVLFLFYLNYGVIQNIVVNFYAHDVILNMLFQNLTLYNIWQCVSSWDP